MNRNRPPTPESSASEKSSTAHGSPRAKNIHSFSRSRATRLMSPAVEGLEDRTLQTALPDEALLPLHFKNQTTFPFTTPDTQGLDPSHPNAFLKKLDTSVIGQLAAEITAHAASVLSTPNDPAILQPLLTKVEQGKAQLDAAVAIINSVHPLLDDAEILLGGWKAKGAPAFDGEPNHQPFSPADFASARISLDASKAKLDNLTRTAADLKLALDKAEAALQEATKDESEQQKIVTTAREKLAEIQPIFDAAKVTLENKTAAVATIQKALDTDTALLDAINKECNDAYAIFWKAAQEYIPVALDSEAHPDDLELKAKADALLKICMPLWIAYDKIASKAFYTRYPIRVRIDTETTDLAIAKGELLLARTAFDAVNKDYSDALARVQAAQTLLDAAIAKRITAQTDRDAKYKAYTDALTSETAVLKEGIATATILFQRLAATDRAFHTVFDTALTTLVADERGLTDTLHAKQHEGVKQLSMQAEAVTGLRMNAVASPLDIDMAIAALGKSTAVILSAYDSAKKIEKAAKTAQAQIEFTDDVQPMDILYANISAYVTALAIRAESLRQIVLSRVQSSITALTQEGISSEDFTASLDTIRTNFPLLSDEEKGLQLARLNRVALMIDTALGKASDELNAAKTLLAQLQTELSIALSTERASLSHRTWQEMTIDENGGITCSALSPDGLTIAAGGTDGVVRFIEAATGTVKHSLALGSESISSIVYFSNGNMAITIGKELRFLNALTGASIATVPLVNQYSMLSVTGNGNLAGVVQVIGTGTFNLVKWSPDGKELLRQELGPEDNPTGFSKDGRTLFIGVRKWMYTREVEQGGMLLSSDFDPIYGSTFTGGDTNDDNTSAVISTRGQFLRLVDSNGKILDDGIYFGNDTRIGSVQNIGHNTFAVDFLLHYKRAVKIFAIVNNKLVERSQTENVRNGIGRLLIAPDNSTAVSVSGVGMGAVALTQPNDFYTRPIAEAQAKIPPAQAEVDLKTLPIAGLTTRSHSLHATADAVSSFLESYLVDAALRAAANVDFPLDATTFDTYFENVESALTALETQPDWTMNTSAGKLNGLALWSGDLATIGQAIMSMAHGMQLVGPFVEATDRAPVFDSLYHRALAQAQRLSKLVDDWQSTHALFEQEAADSLTSATFVSLQNNYENLLSMLVQDTDLSGLTNVSSTDSAATYQLDLVDSGGSLTLQSLKGLYDTPATVTITADQTGTIVTGTGSALSLDFTKAHGSTVKVSLKVLSESGNTVTVAFLQGEKVIAQKTVDSGSVASFEDAAGISGAIIQNEAKGMSDIARELYDFRASYKYPGYAWQDPGADAFFFGYVKRTIPVADQPRIIAEANAGNLTRAVSIADLSLTNNLSNMDGAFGTVSNTENSLYARMNTPRVPSGTIEVEDRWLQVQYTPNQYNAYTLRSYGGGASVQSIGTIGSGHNFRPLPESMYHREGDTILVYPTDQNLQLLLYTTNDNARYHAGIPVNRRFDFEVISKTGTTSTDALNALGKRMSVDSIRLYNINSGGPEGWAEGRTLEQSRSSPVAIGSIMAQADIVNDSDEALNFTVTTYSGLPGVNGWKNPVKTYAGSLAAHSGRTLHTPIQMNTDSQGRGMVRLVITAADGRILAEGMRTVGAATMTPGEQAAQKKVFMDNWNKAMVQARRDTEAYFASIGQTPPAGADFETAIAAAQSGDAADTSPDPALTERTLRLSFRALASAKASGDQSRIALEQKRYNLSIVDHTRAIASMNAAPSESIPAVAQIVMENQIHFASMEQVAGKIHTAQKNIVSDSFQLSQLMDSAVSSMLLAYADTTGMAASAASIEQQLVTVQELPFSELMKQQINNLLRFFKTKEVQDFVTSPGYKQMIENYNNNKPPIGIVYNTVMNWYKPQNAVPGLTFDVRDDSAIGKAFLGLLQQLEASKGNAQQLSDIGRMIQDLTAIPCQQIMATTLTADVSKRAQQLRTLFGYAGYDRIFTSTPPSADTPPYILSAVTDQPKYTGGDIRFRFDVRTGGAKVVGMQVWLDNINGPRELVTSQHSPQLYVKVPVSTIRNPGITRFIVSITLSDGRVIERKTGTVDMQTQLKDLSTASMNTAEGQAQHWRENIILNQVLANFPADRNDGHWQWEIGSEYHYGNEINAMDINIPGSDDRDKPVYAMAEGHISSITTNFGKVLIDHPNANGFTWQSEYMHMPIYESKDASGNTEMKTIFDDKGVKIKDVPVYIFKNKDGNAVAINGVVLKIWEGKSIDTHSQIGVTAGRGTIEHTDAKGNHWTEVSDNAFPYHDHIAAIYNNKTIDMRKVVESMNMFIEATDGGIDDNLVTQNDGDTTLAVHFDEKLNFMDQKGMFVNLDEMLMFDRSEQATSFHDGRWIALSDRVEERVEVKKGLIDPVTKTYGWLAWDSTTNDFLKVNGKRKQWTPKATTSWTLVN